MLRSSKWLPAASLSLCVSAAACANFVDGNGPGQGADIDPDGTAGPPTTAGGKRLSAALVKAEDCPDLLEKLKADAIAKLDLEIALFRHALEQDAVARNAGSDFGGGGFVGTTGGVAVDEAGGFDDGALADLLGGAGSTGTAGAPVPASEELAAGDGVSGAVSDPVGGSETNRQVQDVDEADFVKMVEDKTGFYLLHGQELYAFDAWPAESLARSASPIAIEGSPRELFVRDGKLLVFSTVDRHSLGLPENDRRWQPFTKLSVVDTGKGADLQVEREVYAEGHYTSSRRYDALVRVVLRADSPAPTRFYPEIQTHDAFGNPFPEEEIDAQLAAWRERTANSIEATELSDWLPQQFEREGDELVEVQPACSSHYTPTAGASEAGLTRLLTLDLDDTDAEVGGLTVVGASSEVYSNREAMVLAHNDYRWDARDFGLIDEQRVALHLFDIDGDDTSYTASGWAPGHVLDQFALDERDGVVRISTSGWVRSNPEAEQDDPDFWQTEPVNRVVTLGPKEGELKVLDRTPHLGKEQETTRSTRFIGDRAYVVTFRQTDPLVVVDLSKPESLEVLGELEIPGFSEYMHPLGDHHLLTIGQNGDDSGLTGGIALQIFDVEDATDPKLAHRHAFSPSSSSSASYDHKAFTFYEAQGLLAFPMVDWGEQFQSTLQVFRVSTDDGFEPLGAVDHTALYDSCSYSEPRGGLFYECWYQPDVRRGMFVEGEDETFVYTVSYGGVTSHALSDLAEALATVSLPEPKLDRGGIPYPEEPIWF